MAAPDSREFGGGRTYITFAPPLRSDGVSDNCCPHPEAQDKPEYYSKYLAHFIFTIAGCCLAQGAEWPAPSNQGNDLAICSSNYLTFPSSTLCAAPTSPRL